MLLEIYLFFNRKFFRFFSRFWYKFDFLLNSLITINLLAIGFFTDIFKPFFQDFMFASIALTFLTNSSYALFVISFFITWLSLLKPAGVFSNLSKFNLVLSWLNLLFQRILMYQFLLLILDQILLHNQTNLILP